MPPCPRVRLVDEPHASEASPQWALHAAILRVAEPLRRQGRGRALLQAAEGRARERGHTRYFFRKRLAP